MAIKSLKTNKLQNHSRMVYALSQITSKYGKNEQNQFVKVFTAAIELFYKNLIDSY